MAHMKDQIAEVDDAHLDKVAAIIRSMTPAERTTPKIINGSRRARIAAGSGVTVMDVNQLLNRFTEAQKMMKQMGGMMGLPGAGRRKGTKSPKNKRKGKKGGGGGGSRARTGRGAPGMPGLPRGVPALPPGLDPTALPGADDSFTPPKLDFGEPGEEPGKRRPDQ
jgi:signal recognition particle subunit SRP54